MNPVRYGTQGRVYGGSGRESGNGSMNSANHMRHNKKGHIFWYNDLRESSLTAYGGITYVPISILSHYEKL